MGFEPIVDSSGALVTLIVRAWTDDSHRSIFESLSPTRDKRRRRPLS